MYRNEHLAMNSDSSLRLLLRNNKNLLAIILLLFTSVITFASIGVMEIDGIQSNLAIQTRLIGQISSTDSELIPAFNTSAIILQILCNYVTLWKFNTSCVLTYEKVLEDIYWLDHNPTTDAPQTLKDACMTMSETADPFHFNKCLPWRSNWTALKK